MKLKNRKIARISIVSLTSSLIVVGACYYTNSKTHWLNKVDDYFEEKVEIEQDDEIEIFNRGIDVKSLGVFKTPEGMVRKFTYTIQPDDASITDVAVKVNYKDGSSCEGVVKAELDASKKEITVTCLQDFDQQIILTITSDKWKEVSAEVTIDFEEKVNGLVGEKKIYYERRIKPSNDIIVFTWNSTKFTKAKTDYTFTLSGGQVGDIDTSRMYMKMPGEAGVKFMKDFAQLVVDHFYTETLYANKQDPHKIEIRGNDHFVTGSEVWNLTQDVGVHRVLAKYSEGRLYNFQVKDDRLIIPITGATCIDNYGNEFKVDLSLDTNLGIDMSSCYIAANSITPSIPGITF